MDRRRFLGTLSVLGSCGFVPAENAFASQTADSRPLQVEAASSPDAERALKVGIIAIGSTGNWLLDRLNDTLPQPYRCLSIEGNRITPVRIIENKRGVPGCMWRNNESASRGGVETTADQIAHLIEGMDQLFVLTDMSGRMELEAASVLAEIANREDILMIGAVSKRFGYPKTYGRPRMQDGIEQLQQLGIPTVALCAERNRGQYSWAGEVVMEQLEAAAAFEQLYRSAVLTQEDGQSLVSLDREAVRTVFWQQGVGGMVVGYGSANGPDRAPLAAYRAISHPLFNADRERSDIHVLVSIEARPDRLKLKEVNRVLGVIADACPYCIQFFGAFRNPLLNDDFHVTVVAPEGPWKKT